MVYTAHQLPQLPHFRPGAPSIDRRCLNRVLRKWIKCTMGVYLVGPPARYRYYHHSRLRTALFDCAPRRSRRPRPSPSRGDTFRAGARRTFPPCRRGRTRWTRRSSGSGIVAPADGVVRDETRKMTETMRRRTPRPPPDSG
jgi:hypothetical protein